MLNRLKSRIPVSRRARRAVKAWRTRASIRLGSDRYVWAALHDIDRKLVEVLNGQRGGTFLEVGANDGFQQSNTLALERLFGWSGILVEANPSLAAECARNRPDAVTVCAALLDHRSIVSIDHTQDLMGNVVATSNQLAVAVTMSEIIDHLQHGRIDLISIDVEGAECEVLAGLDLDLHGPRYFVIETRSPDRVTAQLAAHYEQVDQWSVHDFLYRRMEPSRHAF
jgi:FkbM family methyltransferase